MCHVRRWYGGGGDVVMRSIKVNSYCNCVTSQSLRVMEVEGERLLATTT